MGFHRWQWYYNKKHHTQTKHSTQSYTNNKGHVTHNEYNQPTPWSQSASELYRPSHYRLSVKLVPTFADRRCHVVSVTDPYGRIVGFLDRSSYVFFQVAPQLYS
jgi:hypothetical protein